MDRKQYMEKLNMDLEGMDEQSRQEIIQDFDAHFQQGLQEGRSEEEIAEELGDLNSLTKELKSSAPSKTSTSSSFQCDIREVEIHSLCANCTILESEDDQIHVQFYDNRDSLRRLNFDLVTQQIGTLYRIEVKKKKEYLFNFFSFGEDLHLEVSLPHGVANLKAESASGDVHCQTSCNRMLLKSLSGDIKAQELNCEELFIDNVSGDCDVDILKTNVYSIKVISGDLHITCDQAEKGKVTSISGDVKYEGDTKEIIIDTKSGDIQLNLVDGDTCQVKMLSGDITIKLPNEAGFECIYSKLSGDFKTNLKGQVQNQDKLYTYGDGRIKMVIESLSGDVRIKE